MNKRTDQKIDILQTLIRYHADIRSFVDLFEKNVPIDRTNISEELKRLLNSNLILHFSFEGKIVFPIIKKYYPKDRKLNVMVDRLSSEHRDMLKDIHLCIEACGGEAGIAQIMKTTTDIVNTLIGHAREEDEHIVKLVNSKQSIQLLIGREFLKNRHNVNSSNFSNKLKAIKLEPETTQQPDTDPKK